MQVSAFRRALLLSAIVVRSVGCGGVDTLPPPAPVCAINISPGSHSFEATGGAGTISVTAPSGCPWSAATERDWIRITSGNPGSGPGAATYTVESNTASAARTGTITIAEQVHQVAQAGRPQAACSYELSTANADFGADGGTGSFGIDTAGHCRWTVGVNVSWLTVTAAASGTGLATMTYVVARNEEADPRLGIISVEGRNVTARQSPRALACDYTVAPVELRPCMPQGTGSANVSTAASCSWTAVSRVPWLVVSGGASGSGPGAVTFTYTANYNAPREAPVEVRWPTATEGQNIWVRQAGCTYGVSPSGFSFAAAGGTGSFEVVQQSDPTACGGPKQDACIWAVTAESEARSWITITIPMPRIGDDRVSFAVAPNATGVPRAGRITVGERTVTITQAGS